MAGTSLRYVCEKFGKEKQEMSQSSSVPSAPSPSKTYQQGVNVYLRNLPRLLQQEQAYRWQYDPLRIAQQQNYQQLYGPTQYAQQLQALKQLDPYGTALRGTLGTQMEAILKRGYVDPQQAALYRDILAKSGQISPQQSQLYNTLGAKTLANLQQGGIDPRQIAAYKALGQSVTGQLGRGTQLDPAFTRQLQQDIRAGQAARGNVLGNAPISAEALYQGQRAQQLYQQRVGNVQNYLGLQAPEAAALQGAYGFYGLPTPGQAALGREAQAYGLQSPGAQAIAQTGSFLSLPTPEQQVTAIQGITPDRASAYVNPNAGYQGQQFGLQNYQNLLGSYTAGGANPWASALGGAASGAALGTSIYPGYGTAIGAVAGGVGGYFSDEALKWNIARVGTSPSGIPVYEFSFKNDPMQRRFRGTIAQELVKTRWDAVHIDKGKLVVDYDKIDVPFEEVKSNAVGNSES